MNARSTVRLLNVSWEESEQNYLLHHGEPSCGQLTVDQSHRKHIFAILFREKPICGYRKGDNLQLQLMRERQQRHAGGFKSNDESDERSGG